MRLRSRESPGPSTCISRQMASRLTSDQVSAISPAAVQTLAQRVEQHDAGIVEKMSAFYATHPTLVKTLGSAAMMIAMRKIAERQNR